MSRPVTFGSPPARELFAGTIQTASGATCTYVLDDQPDRVRGPARMLRPVLDADPDDPNTPTDPPEGTPCLVVHVGGSLSNAWVIPFQ